MTINRNIPEDRQNTAERLMDRSKHQPEGKDNWLGHTRGAACIDEKLLEGATMAELAQCRGAVREHLRHLEAEHGLSITEGAIKKFVST